ATAAPSLPTLSLHDALPIYAALAARGHDHLVRRPGDLEHAAAERAPDEQRRDVALLDPAEAARRRARARIDREPALHPPRGRGREARAALVEPKPVVLELETGGARRREQRRRDQHRAHHRLRRRSSSFRWR